MKSSIGLKEKSRQIVANELSKILADESVLYLKTKNAHWNVEGADFYTMHKFFETQFIQLDALIDSVAERIRIIGHYAVATMTSYLSLTQLSEKTGEKNHSHGFIKDLLSDHETIAIKSRTNKRFCGNT
jgi:starvation-inducible DNA-binding protein